MIKLDLNPKPQVLGQFAWIAVVGLPLVAFAVLRMFGAFSFTHWAFLGAAALGVLQLLLWLAGLKAPTRATFVGIMVLAFPIGFVVSHVLMGIVYYLVMTPIGLVFRLMGRDVMGRTLDRTATSYWHDRGPAKDPASYFKLY